jgi:hypothetical protein
MLKWLASLLNVRVDEGRLVILAALYAASRRGKVLETTPQIHPVVPSQNCG